MPVCVKQEMREELEHLMKREFQESALYLKDALSMLLNQRPPVKLIVRSIMRLMFAFLPITLRVCEKQYVFTVTSAVPSPMS